MFSLCSNSIYCRYAPIRYEINPLFAQQTYRVRQHISNATGVYRKSREGFISMRDTPLRVSRYELCFFVFSEYLFFNVSRIKASQTGGFFMSPKELLYIEDTLGHEKQIKTTCQESAASLSDAQLKDFVLSVAQKHSDCFNKFYGLLGG